MFQIIFIKNMHAGKLHLEGRDKNWREILDDVLI